MDPDLDRALQDLAFLVERYAEFFPANTGDVSWLVPQATADALRAVFATSATDWVRFDQLETLAALRADGRTGYRSEGIRHRRYYAALKCLAGRMMLITRTGAMLPAIGETVARGRSGELLSIVELHSSLRSIRLVYGVAQYGSIPSIESHLHLLANAITIAQGSPGAAVVHAHPRGCIALGRHRWIAGDKKKVSAMLLTQIEGLNRMYDNIVGVVPYRPSGSAALVTSALPEVVSHAIVLLMNHGVIVRGRTLWECFALLSYAEESALAALESLQSGALGLPSRYVLGRLKKLGLLQVHNQLVMMATRSP